MLTLLFRCANPVETDGETLAKAQCSTCHALPSPSDLDKTTWDQYVLPRMGALMGVLPLDSAGGQFIEPAVLKLGNPAVFRKKADLTKAEWAAIRSYFLQNSPAELPAAEPLNLEALPQFEPRFPDYFLSPPGTLLAQFANGKLLLSDVHKSQLFSFDNDLELQRTAKLPSGVVSLTGIAEGEVATCIGSFSPTDAATASTLAVQEAVTAARLSYKKSEFLIAYLDGFAVKKNINGAPLPSLDPAIPDVMVVEPCGLQVLDELAFGEAPFEEKAAMLALCDKLAQDFRDVTEHQSRLKIEHRHVFEAIRQSLVRTFTLGVTGFDTPGSANAIPEAKAAFEGMYAAFKNYMPLLEQKDRGLAIVLDARMEHTLNYLTENDDFETFDRLAFLMEHVEPQYQLFYEVHKSLGVEFAEEVDKAPRAVNYHAVSLFEPDFLNAGFYANLDLKHPLMEKRRELGRTLFFDPVLSKKLDRSCASCHHPEKAFTDGRPKPLAADGQHSLLRNSPTLVNSVFADQYFWDLREPRLDRQMLHVVKSEEEFDTDYPEIIAKLGQSGEYNRLFAEAYPEQPDYQLSTYTISDALSAYVASLTDFDL
jgi:cytochrome c peroxidase